MIFDPADLLAESGRECPVRPNGYLIPKEDMRNEEGQEVKRAEELVVDAQPWMNPRPLVVNPAVGALV